jgi:rhamnogalacturonyl hydrolase YesR
MYGWVRQCLASGDLYLDHIARDGSIDRTIWTYNQGTMLGAGVLLYQATGSRSYLRQAQHTAAAAMHHFGRAQLADEPPAFVAILFENLALLDAVHHDASYRTYMQSWADRAWSKLRDGKTDLFRFDSSRSPAVLTQGAMTKLYANLARRTSSFR